MTPERTSVSFSSRLHLDLQENGPQEWPTINCAVTIDLRSSHLAVKEGLHLGRPDLWMV